jgi:hypothetical protein
VGDLAAVGWLKQPVHHDRAPHAARVAGVEPACLGDGLVRD